MSDLTLTQLKSLAAEVEQQLQSSGASPVLLNELVDKSLLQSLAKLTDDEAVPYLKSANDSNLPQAYLILSKRLSDSALADICFDYLMRPTFIPRLLGASEIGIYLQGTSDRKASQVLAMMIRNTQEDSGLRCLAYRSLQLINQGMIYEMLQSALDIHHRKKLLENIDWKFVDSFL